MISNTLTIIKFYFIIANSYLLKNILKTVHIKKLVHIKIQTRSVLTLNQKWSLRIYICLFWVIDFFKKPGPMSCRMLYIVALTEYVF